MHVEVDPTLLEDTAANLRDAVEVARDVADHRSRLTALSARCGSATFGAAVESFVDEWGYGMGLVAEDAETLASMLESGAAAYRKVEGSIAAELR